MIVYNISLKIDPAIELSWLSWMKNEHIPEVMATKQFTHHTLYRLLEQNETEEIIYIVQYFAPSIENYNTYIDNFSEQLRQKALDKWNNQFIAFRTLMQSVD